MCSKPKAPVQNVVAPTPPLEAPKPLASPESDAGRATNLSQLRIGSRSNLRMRAGGAGGSLTIPKAP